ncbi:MAG TPA: hypothetical protein VIY48_18180 [Candidatus Paceibacterota bacterium]
MTTPQNMAVAFLLGQQAEENNRTEAEENARVRALFEGSKAKAPKAAKATRAKREPKETPVKPKSGPPPMVFAVEPGSIGAAGFLKMLRSAKDRQQSIEAIHAYVGYDMAGDFGTQEYRAKAKANLELKPIAIVAKATPVMQGYVAGMPNNAGKFQHNLKARERLAVEGLIENLKIAESVSDEREVTLRQGLAQVEAERIRNIRQDLNRAHGNQNTLVGLG